MIKVERKGREKARPGPPCSPWEMWTPCDSCGRMCPTLPHLFLALNSGAVRGFRGPRPPVACRGPAAHGPGGRDLHQEPFAQCEQLSPGGRSAAGAAVRCSHGDLESHGQLHRSRGERQSGGLCGLSLPRRLSASKGEHSGAGISRAKEVEEDGS